MVSLKLVCAAAHRLSHVILSSHQGKELLLSSISRETTLAQDGVREGSYISVFRMNMPYLESLITKIVLESIHGK